jgi:hypothetical protein
LVKDILALKIGRNFCSIKIENLLGYPAFQKVGAVEQKKHLLFTFTIYIINQLGDHGLGSLRVNFRRIVATINRH